MEEKLNKLNNYLLFPGAIVALMAGIISIYKDTVWYIYLPLFSITVVFILIAILKKRGVHEFEVVWHTMIIEIHDNLGQNASFTNQTLLKALRKGAHNFDYILYCDGKIKNIKVKEGSVIEIKQESGRLLVKTNTEHPLSKGDQVEHTLTAKYLNGFLNEKEYWQTAKNFPGTNLKIIILTTTDRPIKDYKAFKIIGHSKLLLDQQPRRITYEGKQGIVLDYQQAKFLERYRIEWSW